MRAPAQYTWIPGVFADGLQAGDRVSEFADFVTSVTPGRRPDVVDVTFAETGGTFHLHVAEQFTVSRPLAGPDEDTDGQQHDEAGDDEGERW